MLIQNMKLKIRDGNTKTTGGHMLRFLGTHRAISHMDGSLCNPIHVDEAGPLLPMPLKPRLQRVKVQRLSSEYHPPQLQLLLLLLLLLPPLLPSCSFSSAFSPSSLRLHQ